MVLLAAEVVLCNSFGQRHAVPVVVLHDLGEVDGVRHQEHII